MVWLKSNPHVWSSNDDKLIVAYDNRDDADNFVAIHPQYHYRSGYAEPHRILEVQEIKLGEVWEYWKPAFP